MTRGQCLCGAVRYEVDGDLGETAYCYCDQCRRASGSAFTANVRLPRTQYRLLAGAAQIREYQSSPGAFRAFCAVCGSPVHARLEHDPAYIRIRLGGLEASAPARAVAHVWVSEKPVWHEIADALPQFSEGSDRKR